MTRINGIRCNWCGAIKNLVGDQAKPADWKCLILAKSTGTDLPKDLCGKCAGVADVALRKAEKRCKTGRTQR